MENELHTFVVFEKRFIGVKRNLHNISCYCCWLWSAAEEETRSDLCGETSAVSFHRCTTWSSCAGCERKIFFSTSQTCSALPQPTFEPIILLNIIIGFQKWPRKAKIPLLEIITHDISRQKLKWLVRATNTGVSHLLLITLHSTLTISDGSAVFFQRLTGETDTYGSDPPAMRALKPDKCMT